MKPRALFNISLTSLLALLSMSGSKIFAADAQPAEPEKYALMIGINKYKSKPLDGCENDTKAIKKVLVDKHRFKDDEHIKLLLSEQATKQAIIDAFKSQLTANAKRLKEERKTGIFVFQYSGHGSRVPDLSGDEADGFDETLCPVDVIVNDQRNDLLDDTFNELLDELTRYTDNVTLIIDSCHSGTITRGFTDEFKSRSLERPELEKQVASKTRGGGTSPPEKLMVPPGKKYVVLAGCMPDELSLESTDKNGVQHGLMTSALLTFLDTANALTTYRDIWEKVDAAIKLRVNSQNPQIEGDMDRLLFQGAGARVPTAFHVVNDLGDSIVEIDAGTSLGVMKGGIVAFYKKGSKLVGDDGKITLGDVIETDNFKSTVKLRDKVGNDIEIEKTQVVAVTPFFGKNKMSVVLHPLKGVKSKNTQLWKNLNSVLPTKDAFDFKQSTGDPLSQKDKEWQVAIVSGTGSDFKKFGGKLNPSQEKDLSTKPGIFLATKEGTPLYNLFVPDGITDGAKAIVDALENRSRQEAIRSFKNDCSDIANDIEVKIERVTSKKLKSGSTTAYDYTFKEEPSDNLSIPSFKQDDRFRLAITNKGTHPLYVTGVCLGADGSVQVAFPRKGEGAGKGDALLPTKTVHSTVLHVDSDSPLGFETLKLLVTSGTVDYSSLEQPKAAIEVLDRGGEKSRGDNSSDGVRDMLLQAMYKPQDQTRTLSEDVPDLNDWFAKRIDYRVVAR
ncbi:caspase family protein [Candidatus Obscuribacterales bacterium]|nr:caspase family protein [Candidatus Obscuribacterales bacterium]